MRLASLCGLWVLVISAMIAPGRVSKVEAISDLPAGFVEDPPITGFAAPIAFDWTPDGRMFVGEKGGNLRVVNNGVLLPTPALSLSVSSNSERGLLGVVLDPEFSSRPYIYLYYTTGPGSLRYGGSPKNRVARFTVSGDTADPASEHILIDNIPSDAGNHNAGDLHFGPDGMLYASTGDGGSNRQNSQDLSSLAGKILRVDPESGQGVVGSPFFSSCPATACEKRIWAYGLRNPFRFAIQPETGVTYIADVGQNTYEEINRLDPQSSGAEKPGANYGWPQVEGPNPPGVAGMTYPVFSYARSGNAEASFNGCYSVTGGDFVKGPNFPGSYSADYFFADFGCGRVWRLQPGASPTVTLFASDAGGVVHLAFGPDGMLYRSNIFGNEVRRIRYTIGNRPPTAQATAEPKTGPLPLAVAFSSAGSGDPDGDPISYMWELGDGSTSTAPNPTHTYTTAGVFQARLTVRDSRGATTSATPITIRAGNRAPQATIIAPADGARYRVGAAITLQGTGVDPDDGTLSGASLSWTVLRRHGTSHTHPWASGTGPSLTTTMPPPEDLVTAGTSFLEARLTVTDSAGATHTQSIPIRPETVQLTFWTQPSGLRLVLDGAVYATPVTVTSANGWSFEASAPFQGRPPCQVYAFETWSDGGAATHQLTTPDNDMTFTATFAPRKAYCSFLPRVESP